MTNLRKATDALEAARGEHRRALRRVANLRSRAQTAASRIAGAIASIEEQAGSLAENSEATVEMAVQLASERGVELAGKMSDLSDKAAERTAGGRQLVVNPLTAKKLH